MQLLKQEKFKKKIKKEFDYKFEVKEKGLYAIEITASCKGWLQNLTTFISFFKDDDLTIKIDDVLFPKLDGRRGLFDGEVAWNGNNLNGLVKTNVFLINLDKGSHTIHFLVDQKPYLGNIKIYSLKDNSFEITNRQPQDGNRRQWMTFILADLSLKRISITATASKHSKEDDDDLKLIIDNVIQKNTETKSHKYWYWCGRTLKGRKKEYTRDLNLPQRLHYIELWTDRMPKLDEIRLIGLGKKLLGKVALHQDIEQTNFVNLRSSPDHKSSSNIITQLKDGEILEILKERVIGSWVTAKSFIWHEIKHKDKTGYILSSFVEVGGQERSIVLNKIKMMSSQVGMDKNLMSALAGCESRYKPYAASSENFEKSAKGIFQLTTPAIKQLAQNRGEYYYEVKDSFDINQNIEGGIRYVKWLYDTYYKGADQEVEKLIAAYNQGQSYFPPDEPLDWSRLPTIEKQKEAQRIVKCVLKNKKRKNWKFIFWPVLISLFMIFVGLGAWHLNQGDFFEPIVSEEESMTAAISRFPSAIFKQETNKIVLFNSQGKITAAISEERLGVNKIFNIPAEFQKGNLIHLSSAIESSKNIFYFLVATSWSCGASNCTWVLYRYNAKEDFLEVIDNQIFGSTTLYLSPQADKLILLSHSHGGYCNGSSDLTIIDLKNFNKERIIEEFDLGVYTYMHIDFLGWRNNDEMKLEVYEQDCSNLSSPALERVFTYNIKTRQIKLISEKIPASS